MWFREALINVCAHWWRPRWPKNQKFDSFRKSLSKINSVLSEWWSLVHLVFDCLLYHWKTQPLLFQSYSLDKLNFKYGGFLSTPRTIEHFGYYELFNSSIPAPLYVLICTIPILQKTFVLVTYMYLSTSIEVLVMEKNSSDPYSNGYWVISKSKVLTHSIFHFILVSCPTELKRYRFQNNLK